jgi:hypothetical protein
VPSNVDLKIGTGLYCIISVLVRGTQESYLQLAVFSNKEAGRMHTPDATYIAEARNLLPPNCHSTVRKMFFLN